MIQSAFSHKLCNELLRRRPSDNMYVPSKYYEGAMTPSEDVRGFSEIILALDLHIPENECELLLSATMQAFRQGRMDLRGARYTVIAWDGKTIIKSMQCRYSALEQTFKDIRVPAVAMGNWSDFSNKLIDSNYNRAEGMVLMCDKSMFAVTDAGYGRRIKNAVITYITSGSELEAEIIKTQMKAFGLDANLTEQII